MNQNLNDLKKKEKEYWDDLQGDPDGEKRILRETYIEKILPNQIESIKGPETYHIDSCRELVFLVGTSIEPILQSLCVYKPEVIKLVCNRQIGLHSGESQGRLVESLVTHLESKFPGLKKIDSKILKLEGGDQPADVFALLLKEVRRTEGVVIDITGAKKSMIAGAFMFACMADVPVSYVDFVEYDKDRRRPSGYNAIIGQVSNLVETFALRHWERIRIVYNRYKFREARILLAGEPEKRGEEPEKGTVLHTMKKYLPGSKSSIEKLSDAIYFHELWDRGDFNEARKYQPQFANSDCIPSVVTQLGGSWYTMEGSEFKDGPSDFYEDTPRFRAYVYDDLARVGRLIDCNNDYRSAYLKACNLNEVLMIARLVRLMPTEYEKNQWINALQIRTPAAKNVFRFLAQNETAHQTVAVIEKLKKFHKDIRQLNTKVTFTERMNWHENIPVFGNRGDWEALIDRRNDMTHKYYAPPKRWADDAYKFVQANVEDFYKNNSGPPLITEKLEWKTICEGTGADKFLPPQLLDSSRVKCDK